MINVNIFADSPSERELTKDAEVTKAFFEFCCLHSGYVSLERPHHVIRNISQQTEGLRNKMDSAIRKMAKKYATNEDGYADELRRTHSINDKSQFDEYIAKVRKDNEDILRQMDAKSSPNANLDYSDGLNKIGLIESEIVGLSEQLVERCFFPVAAVQKYLEKAVDIFQFPILVGEHEFEDWTFYRKGEETGGAIFARAISHEGQAWLTLTESEYEEFKRIGVPPTIVYKPKPSIPPKELRPNEEVIEYVDIRTAYIPKKKKS